MSILAPFVGGLCNFLGYKNVKHACHSYKAKNAIRFISTYKTENN